MTVIGRRSASSFARGAGVIALATDGVAEGSASLISAAAAMILRRWPIRATPRSFKS